MKRKRRRLLLIAFCVSVFVHSLPSLWGLLSLALHHDVKVHDTEGEATFPVDLLAEEAPRPPAPQVLEPKIEEAPRRETAKSKDPPGDTLVAGRPAPDGGTADRDRAGLANGDPSLAAHGDAGTRRDGSAPPVDASTDASPDASDASPVDAGLPSDAGDAIAPGGDAAVVAIGAGDSAKNTIELVLDLQVLRAHPAAARLEALLGNLRQWRDFFHGTGLQPIRDLDWIGVYGPGLLTTDRDVLMLQYSAPDRVVDDAVAALARKAGRRGGPFDLGIDGVPATRAFADRAERVIFRPRPRVVAIVPPARAHAQAVAYRDMQSAIKGPGPAGDAVSMTVNEPHRVLPDIFPETVSALHLRVALRAGGAADVEIVGDCPGVVQCQALEDDAKLALGALVGTRSVGALLSFRVPPGLSASAEALGRATFGYDARHFSARLTASLDVIGELIEYAASIDHIKLPPPKAPAGGAPRPGPPGSP